MFWTFFNTSNKKKKRRVSHIKKDHYFFEESQWSLFKKRKKTKISFYPEKYIPFVSIKNRIFPLVIFVLLLFSWTVFLFFSSFLTVQEVHIFREDSIINIDQAYGNIDYIRWKNILFLDTNEIALRLQKSQKSISSIKFDVDFPRYINIYLGAYPALFQTQTQLILSNGTVVSKDSKQYVWVPFIQTSKSIDEYATFWSTLNTNDLSNLSSLISHGKKNILGFDFKNIKYFIVEKELLLMHSSGSIFIFDLSNSVEDQIEKLAVYEKEEWSIDEKKYIYIDVRIPEKLFLCSIETEYDCRNNLKQIYGSSIFVDLLPESSELIQ